MKQKLIKLVALTMTLLMCAAVLCSAAEEIIVTEFSDVSGEYWGYQTIMKMTQAGIFRGTTPPVNGVGTFMPEKVMTRAEFITSALRAIYPEETKNIANDQTNWWRGYYLFAVEKGILKIAELENGALDKPMSREEMAMIMVRCVENCGETLTRRIAANQIPDYDQIGYYYRGYVLDCFSFGLLCGIDPQWTFAPKSSLRRAEAATVICRLIDKGERVKIEWGEADTPQVPSQDVEKLPWENGGKQPSEYTWAEFQALPSSMKYAFIESFGSNEAFNKWMNSVKPAQETEKLPWENGGKQPSEYTWAEFQALSDSLKDAFIESFGSTEKFNEWMNRVKPSQETEKLPWENGGKQPSEYTWAEFQALSDSLKDAFMESFGSTEEFNEWMNSVKPSENTEKLPWENGGKQPSEYTWAEFQALSGSLKDAFIESFGSTEAFNEWANNAQGSQSDTTLPWENGGKRPSEYTWAEFQALSDLLKDAFIESFGSIEAFNAWKNKAQGLQNGEKLPWESGGKQPSEYTWTEFQALSDLLKDAFIESFGSIEAFNKWMDKAKAAEQGEEKLPWENGGKQPSEYTLEEFEALPDYQKAAFVDSFGGEEAFMNWYNSNVSQEA